MPMNELYSGLTNKADTQNKMIENILFNFILLSALVIGIFIYDPETILILLIPGLMAIIAATRIRYHLLSIEYYSAISRDIEQIELQNSSYNVNEINKKTDCHRKWNRYATVSAVVLVTLPSIFLCVLYNNPSGKYFWLCCLNVFCLLLALIILFFPYYSGSKPKEKTENGSGTSNQNEGAKETPETSTEDETNPQEK